MTKDDRKRVAEAMSKIVRLVAVLDHNAGNYDVISDANTAIMALARIVVSGHKDRIAK